MHVNSTGWKPPHLYKKSRICLKIVTFGCKHLVVRRTTSALFVVVRRQFWLSQANGQPLFRTLIVDLCCTCLHNSKWLLLTSTSFSGPKSQYLLQIYHLFIFLMTSTSFSGPKSQYLLQIYHPLICLMTSTSFSGAKSQYLLQIYHPFICLIKGTQNGLLQSKSIHPLWKILEKCTTGECEFLNVPTFCVIFR